jgi:hypothetical protein
MKRVTLVQLIFIGVLLVLTGCRQEEGMNAEPELSTPLQWIYFKGEKYEFNRVVPVEEINRAELTPTGAFTGEGDGFLSGQEVFLYELDGSIFAVDDTGPTEEWVNFAR